MKSKKIAKYARMASNELHEEWLAVKDHGNVWYLRDALSEAIDKLNHIHIMAARPWWHWFLLKYKWYRNYNFRRSMKKWD